MQFDGVTTLNIEVHKRNGEEHTIFLFRIFCLGGGVGYWNPCCYLRLCIIRLQNPWFCLIKMNNIAITEDRLSLRLRKSRRRFKTFFIPIVHLRLFMKRILVSFLDLVLKLRPDYPCAWSYAALWNGPLVNNFGVNT